MNRQFLGELCSVTVAVSIWAALLVGCMPSRSDLAVVIDDEAEEIAVVIRNNGNKVREVDDQFLRDYAGSQGALQLIVRRSGERIEQCRSMDYFGPPKVVKVLPGSEARVETGLDALIHTFCLYEAGGYSLQATLREAQGVEVLSNRARFVITQEKVDHHVHPSGSRR